MYCHLETHAAAIRGLRGSGSGAPCVHETNIYFASGAVFESRRRTGGDCIGMQQKEIVTRIALRLAIDPVTVSHLSGLAVLAAS